MAIPCSPWATAHIQAEGDTIRTYTHTHDDPLQSARYTSNTTITGDVFDFSRSAATCSAIRLSLVRRSVDVVDDTLGYSIDRHVHGRSARVLCDRSICLLSHDYRWLYRLGEGYREGSKVFIGWRQCPRTRRDPSITSSGTKFFLSGGWSQRGLNGIEHLNDVWELDVNSAGPPSWNLLSPRQASISPPGRGGHSSVTNGQKLYIFGGVTGTGLCNDTWEFELHTRTWVELGCAGDIPMERNFHQAVLMDDVMYIFGGWSFNERLVHDVVALNISGRQWTHLRDFSDPIMAAAKCPLMVAFGSKLYLLSGWHPSQEPSNASINDVHILDTRFVADPVSGRLLHSHLVPPLLPYSALTKLSMATEDAPFVVMDGQSPIKSGGFGDMFRGLHRPSGCSLAMKRPILGRSGDRVNNKRRFLREGKVWSGFNHKNILPFLGIMEREDELYIMSPWMERGDLSNLLVLRNEFTERRRVFANVQPGDPLLAAFDECRIVYEIASGLWYLHSMGYVHGDIKPQNVILDNNGHALLGDFGLSKVSGEVTSAALRGVGSIRWQAPELLDGASKSVASDVYAFAMTIVEILTGNTPFTGMGDTQVLVAVYIKRQRPEAIPLSREGRDLRSLWNLASDCWEHEPEGRPSMDTVLARFSDPGPGDPPVPAPLAVPNIVALFSYCRRTACGHLPQFGRGEHPSSESSLWIEWNSRRYPLDKNYSCRNNWEGWNQLSGLVLNMLTSQSNTRVV